MNIVQLQDQLKNFSQDQLVREMQSPSGNAPQFLVLGEIMRRQKMQKDFTAQQAKDDGGTVAQEAVAAAGVPQGGIADMARAMAPSTDMTQNTGVQAMYAGGPVKKMAAGDKVVRSGVVYIEQEDGRLLPESAEDQFATRRDLASAYQNPGSSVPTGEGELFSFETSPQAPKSTFSTTPLLPPEIDRPGLYSLLRGKTATAENADDLLAKGEISSEQHLRLTRGSRGEQGEVIREMLRGQEGEALTAPKTLDEIVATEQAAAAPTAPSRADRDQQGGGIAAEKAKVEKAAEEKAAADAAAQPTSQGGGAGGAGGMSSFEQELMDALGRREKAAEQDKWLALAQVGLNLMSSTQPTLGGALGEAGLKGVEAVRGARDQYDKDRLELLGALEQSRAARAKAAAGGGGGLTAYQEATLGRYARQDAISMLGTLYDRLGALAPTGVPLPQSVGDYERTKAQIAAIENDLYGGVEAESGEAIDVRTKT